MHPEVERKFLQVPDSKMQLGLILYESIMQAANTMTATLYRGQIAFFYKEKPVAFMCLHADKPGVELGFYQYLIPLQFVRNPKRFRFANAEQIMEAPIAGWLKEAIDKQGL